MTTVMLRPATPADSEFCYQLHKAAMGDYITAVWGWDEQRQRGAHNRKFNPGRWQIITAGGADIGMIDVEHRPGEIYLSRIEICPDHQGRGIGTRLIPTRRRGPAERPRPRPRRACRQPPRPSPLPAARHDRSSQAR